MSSPASAGRDPWPWLTSQRIAKTSRRIPDTTSAPPAPSVVRHVSFAPQYRLYRGHQLVARAVLGDETESTGGLAPLHQLGIVLNSDKDHAQVWLPCEKGGRRRDA